MVDKSPTTASLWRRLAAIVYDSLLLAALWLLGTWVAVLLHGDAIVGSGFMQSYLLALSYIFFCGFWVTAGQTLGMRAWRLRLHPTHTKHLSWRLASLRFFSATVSLLAFGCGFWWALVDQRQRTWHDLWSKSELQLETRTHTQA